MSTAALSSSYRFIRYFGGRINTIAVIKTHNKNNISDFVISCGEYYQLLDSLHLSGLPPKLKQKVLL